jgi:hypothetical protein
VWRLIPLAALLAAMPWSQATCQEIWFSPWSNAKDFVDLFEPNAPWQNAASQTKIFEIAPSLAASAPEPMLRRIFSDLERRKIGLLVGIAPLSGGRGGCGYHVEGYSATGEPESIAQRMKRLGGNPQYFAFDEPLYYGHKFERQGAAFGCHSSIDDIAKDVATKVGQIRSVFPGVPIGDVEPFPGVGPDWLQNIEAWIDAFQRETGTPLAFLRLDIGWDGPWQQQLPALGGLLRRKHVQLQVIYNGDTGAHSDAEWIQSAVRNFQAFEAITRPDVAAIQFWTPHPSRILPETDVTTATWLVDQYSDWRNSHH